MGVGAVAGAVTTPVPVAGDELAKVKDAVKGDAAVTVDVVSRRQTERPLPRHKAAAVSGVDSPGVGDALMTLLS